MAGYVLTAILALVVGCAVGVFFGWRRGVSFSDQRINKQLGSVDKEVVRIKEEAEQEAKRIREEAENINLEAKRLKDTSEMLQNDAQRIRNEADAAAERILLSAQEKVDAKLKEADVEIQQRAIESRRNIDKEAAKRQEELGETEKILRKKEELLDKRSETLDVRDNELKTLELNTKKAVKQAKKRIKQSEEILEEAQRKLEEIAGLTAEDAKKSVIESVLVDAKLEAAKYIKQIETEAEEEAEKRAKMVLSVAIQRYAGDYVVERCVRAITLPSDEVKGRIIGREGRNIRSIEAVTGVDLIVDDTPETVVISAFDPVRREVAAQTLKRLIADGRIHPGRIEETVAKVQQEIDEQIREAGNQAFFELGIQNVEPEVVRMVGRLKYRTSYGQNIWSHSIEAAWLCGIMAAELGLDIKLARRVGLLHDIGKAMDHEQEGSHALIGADYLKKHGEDEIVINAVAAHHCEEEPTSIYAHLVMAADALSGARPGARREILESYIKRLEDIEKISLSFEGVEKCYAIQAGREIRVIVEPEKISDEQAVIISHDIARRIEKELSYPGRIKVCVIRETRAVDTAR